MEVDDNMNKCLVGVVVVPVFLGAVVGTTNRLAQIEEAVGWSQHHRS